MNNAGILQSLLNVGEKKFYKPFTQKEFDRLVKRYGNMNFFDFCLDVPTIEEDKALRKAVRMEQINTSMLNELNMAELGFKCIKPRDNDYNYDTDKYIKVFTMSGEKYDEIRALLANDPLLNIDIIKYVEIRPTSGYDINNGIKIYVKHHKDYSQGEIVFKGVVDNLADMKTLLRLLELE